VLANLTGSFLTALCEAAVLSSSEARVRARIEAGDSRAVKLLELMRDPGRTLTSIVILNNFFVIAGTAAIAAIATTVVPGGATGMAIFIVLQTLLTIAFGEIAPKVLGEAQPEGVAVRFAPALVALRPVLALPAWLLERFTAWARPKERVRTGEEAEIRQLARLGEEAGHIAAEEAELIRRVFRLDDIAARDVMTPRALVEALYAESVLDDIREQLLGSSHKCFPVFEKDLDTVTGVLRLRDALAALASNAGSLTVGDLQRPPFFLPTSRKVDDIMRDLQDKSVDLAVVIDEYGVTEGIISMGDLVEEVVGEAIDEADLREGLVKRLSRTTALVHGLTRVRDVARFLNCARALEDLAVENSTVTGLLQERLTRIPVAGDRVEVEGGLVLQVREANDRTALRILATAGHAPRPRPQRSRAAGG
jgi:CBS domain containing-hemolysin-like protein